MVGGVGHTGGLTNPRPWHGRCRAGFSNTGGPPLPRKRAPLQKRVDWERYWTMTIWQQCQLHALLSKGREFIAIDIYESAETNKALVAFSFVSSCWLTRSHIERFPTQLDIFRRSGDKGCFDNRSLAPPADTVQLVTLHRHRANNQYRMANKIKPTSRVSSSAQAIHDLSSTNRAQQYLTSVIIRELVFPTWYT